MGKYLLFLVAITALIALSYTQDAECTINTFRINGNGVVYITPDIATLSLTATGNGPSAAAALANMNTQVAALTGVFKAQGIPNGNYSTSSINIYDVYDYSTSPYRISGSQATQTIQVTIGASTNLGGVLSSLTNVTVNYITFDVLNHNTALRKARLAAFADAKSKFSQYLMLSSKKNGGILKINDLNSDVYTTYQYSPNAYILNTKLQSPPSPVQVSASVSVTWRIKS